MVRQTPTGLAAPPVTEAGLRLWVESVTERLNNLDAEFAGIGTGAAATGTGTGAGTGPLPPAPTPDPGVPILTIPPTPINVTADAGIGIVIVTWANPFRQYQNHARALIYRNTADDFATAVEIGQAEWLLFVDDNVQEETDYWYWVRFESTSGVQGQISASAMATTPVDPEAFYMRLVMDLEADPLTAALRMDIGSPQSVTEEIRRIAAEYGLLLAGLAQYNQEQTASTTTIAEAAQAAADTASAAVANAVADLAALTTRVTDAEDVNTMQNTSIGELMTEILGRATVAAVNALGTRVTANEASITANAAAITLLTTDLADKAATSALNALTTRVTENEAGIQANATAIAALQASAGGVPLGPEQNVFMGDTRAAAETARDTYEAANADWLAQYDANPELAIELQWQ